MTIMTAMEGITAPARAAAERAPITETFLPEDETPLLSSRRADGWSAANQRLFLEALAEGHGVEQATMRVGLSAASAYAFRRTAKGAAFALGWRAASLVARDAIAETLLVRALEGTVDTIVRGETVITRHKYDNRLALSLLARLDRQAETAPDADIKAARLVAQEFDAFLDLVGKDAGPARAGLFLARRAGSLAAGEDSDQLNDLAPIYALAAADRFARTGVAIAADIDVSDLDPARRAGWTADQWTRAEAAGLVALAPPAPDPAEENALSSQHSQCSPDDAYPPYDPNPPVWWDGDADEWRTRFPPPADFHGHEDQDVGHVDYERTLTDEEAALMGMGPCFYDDHELAGQADERDAYFSALAGDAADPEIPAPGGSGESAEGAKGDEDDPAEISLTHSKSTPKPGTPGRAARSPEDAAPAAGELT